MTSRVVLVRPWTDAHGGTGCCSGDALDGICLEGAVDGPREHDPEVDVVAEAYRRLRVHLPGVDVQVVGSDNIAYLLPWVFRSVRRHRGVVAALRKMNAATTPGSLLLDGDRLGDIGLLGPEGVVLAVRRRLDGHTNAGETSERSSSSVHREGCARSGGPML